MLTGPTVSIVKDEQLELLVINNAFAKAEISLFGGHVLSYIPKSDGRERLWLSPMTAKNAVKPIRGGVPVCWPWFSDLHGQEKGTLPSHGYVRNQIWTVLSNQEDEEGTTVTLAPLSSEGNGFDGHPLLTLTIHVGEKLSLALCTQNNGDKAFTFTCALHSYFKVDDIKQVTLNGISGEYEDKTQGFKTLVTPDHYLINQETDRVHRCQASEVQIVQPDINTQVQSSGHDSLVVWNPWQQNSAQMSDMSDDGYQFMLCVETAITQGQTLLPGDSHTLVQTVL